MSLLIRTRDCVYCGMTATSRDHFIPLKYETETNRHLNFELHSCHPCNNEAGVRVFHSWFDKASHLGKKAQEQNRYDAIAHAAVAKIVGEVILLFINGRHKITPGKCTICGNTITPSRLNKQISMNIPDSRRTCRARCLKSLHYDDKRKTHFANKRDIAYRVSTGELPPIKLRRITKKHRTHISDLWRK